ncbi:hypothetical protein BC332_23971 [Capsicum chinense]|nr:hypothetical protein BC332_23971 [Capsicum chinense]
MSSPGRAGVLESHIGGLNGPWSPYMLSENKSMQAMCCVYAAISYICMGDAESSAKALDLIGPVLGVMDSFTGVREKTSVLLAHGFLLMRQQNLQEARNRLAFGLQTTHNTLGNLQLVSQYLTVLGNLGLALCDTVQAREILRSSLTLAKKLNDIPTQIWVLSNLTEQQSILNMRQICMLRMYFFWEDSSIFLEVSHKLCCLDSSEMSSGACRIRQK